MFEVLGLVAGFGLSFLGAGVLWTGHLSGEIFVAASFLLAGCLLAHRCGAKTALICLGAGALPLSMLVVQFRDPAGSHLGPVAIVLGWVAGLVLGALVADRTRFPLRRFLAWTGIATAVHALAALTCLLAGFGDAMQRFDGKAGAAGAGALNAAGDVLMQPLLGLWAQTPGALTPGAQWAVFGLNSLTWGIAVAACAALLAHLRGKPASLAAD